MLESAAIAGDTPPSPLVMDLYLFTGAKYLGGGLCIYYCIVSLVTVSITHFDY